MPREDGTPTAQEQREALDGRMEGLERIAESGTAALSTIADNLTRLETRMTLVTNLVNEAVGKTAPADIVQSKWRIYSTGDFRLYHRAPGSASLILRGPAANKQMFCSVLTRTEFNWTFGKLFLNIGNHILPEGVAESLHNRAWDFNEITQKHDKPKGGVKAIVAVAGEARAELTDAEFVAAVEEAEDKELIVWFDEERSATFYRLGAPISPPVVVEEVLPVMDLPAETEVPSDNILTDDGAGEDEPDTES